MQPMRAAVDGRNSSDRESKRRSIAASAQIPSETSGERTESKK
jgi:hypothetical protein